MSVARLVHLTTPTATDIYTLSLHDALPICGHYKGGADTRQRIVAAQFSRSPIGLPVCPESEQQNRNNRRNRSPVREHHRGSEHSANKPMSARAQFRPR